MYEHILQLTKGLLFFGIPFAGLQTEELRNAIWDVDPEKDNAEQQRWRRDMQQLLDQLEPESCYLEKLRDDVRKMLNALGHKVEITSFYETAMTNTVRKVSLRSRESSTNLFVSADCRRARTIN